MSQATHGDGLFDLLDTDSQIMASVDGEEHSPVGPMAPLSPLSPVAIKSEPPESERAWSLEMGSTSPPDTDTIPGLDPIDDAKPFIYQKQYMTNKAARFLHERLTPAWDRDLREHVERNQRNFLACSSVMCGLETPFRVALQVHHIKYMERVPKVRT